MLPLLQRVGRFIARRWRILFPDRVLRRSMTLSGALHMALLVVFTLMPAWPRNIHWQSPPLMVTLVSLPAPAPDPEPARTPPAETQAPKLSVPKKMRETPQEAPPKREPPKPRPAPPDTAVQRPPTDEAVTVTARVDESQFIYDYYLQVVVGKISAAWEPPAGLSGQDAEVTATMQFRILRDGQVSNAAVEVASQVAVFDRSAREAILRAQPLPPLPPGYGGRWLTVHLRFALSE